MAASTEGDRSDEDAVGAAAPTTETPTGGVGDLEFDEAWRGASSADDVRLERPQREPEPTFEDPNDR